MNKIEKFLISKKETNLIECITLGGSHGSTGETVLSNIEDFGRSVIPVMFDDETNAWKAIMRKKELYEKYEGNLALYWYDNKTKPEDLTVVRLIIEEFR